jgi:hypothetical protein
MSVYVIPESFQSIVNGYENNNDRIELILDANGNYVIPVETFDNRSFLSLKELTINNQFPIIEFNPISNEEI